MQNSSPALVETSHKIPAPLESAGELAAWFDAAPASARRPTTPPAPVSVVGEFLGDELADAWLR